MDKRIKIDIKDWLETKFAVIPAPFPDVRLDCPFCGDTRGRMYIATEDYKDIVKGMAFCHNEQKNYSFFEIFRDQENLSDAETFEQLYDDDPEPMYGDYRKVLASFETKTEAQPEEPLAITWPNDYKQLWGIDETLFNKLVPPYMIGRKLDRVMCDKYFLGFTGSRSRFPGRVIIPIYQHHELVGWQGRAMHKAIQPKYRFMDGIIAGDYLYNFDAIPEHYDWVIVVEGIFDAWAMIRAGFLNVVASFGKHLTDKGKKTLHQRFKTVVLMYDNDAIAEMIPLAKELQEWGLIIEIALLENKDPDESQINEIVEIVNNREVFDASLERRLMIKLLEGIENKAHK